MNTLIKWNPDFTFKGKTTWDDANPFLSEGTEGSYLLDVNQNLWFIRMPSETSGVVKWKKLHNPPEELLGQVILFT